MSDGLRIGMPCIVVDVIDVVACKMVARIVWNAGLTLPPEHIVFSHLNCQVNMGTYHSAASSDIISSPPENTPPTGIPA